MASNIPILNMEFNSLNPVPDEFKNDFIKSLTKMIGSFQNNEVITIVGNLPFNIEQSENNTDFVIVDLNIMDSKTKRDIKIHIYGWKKL